MSTNSAPRNIAPDTPKLQTTYNAHIRVDATSPVMRNGCFEFDRVIKSGQVLKRTRKTKSWKTVFLVLRPKRLSVYKDLEGTKLRNQITLSDLTAVARQRDPKRKGHHVFGLFSPSSNYHIETSSERDAQEWVELIRREARMDEEDGEMAPMSPTITHGGPRMPYGTRARGFTVGSSSDDQEETFDRSVPRPTTALKEQRSARRPSHSYVNFSGNEGSVSEFSDFGAFDASVTSFSNYQERPQSQAKPPSGHGIYGVATAAQSQREVSGGSALTAPDDRVVCQGWLYLLKSRHGVRQWRSVWAVVRPKAFAIYKNEEEYSAMLIIAFCKIQDAVDCDPLSKTKTACLQLLTEEKNYRFCAMSEDALARWLGAFKSLLAKRKDGEMRSLGSTKAIHETEREVGEGRGARHHHMPS